MQSALSGSECSAGCAATVLLHNASQLSKAASLQLASIWQICYIPFCTWYIAFLSSTVIQHVILYKGYIA